MQGCVVLISKDDVGVDNGIQMVVSDVTELISVDDEGVGIQAVMVGVDLVMLKCFCRELRLSCMQSRRYVKLGARYLLPIVPSNIIS